MNPSDFNKKVTHPLQSFEWGEFREKTGVKVVRGKDFQLTIHKIPYLNYNIGYLPKGNLPNKKLIEELRKIGKENNCIFIQLEPNIRSSTLNSQFSTFNLIPAAHPLFTRYTFILDLTKNEEELLAGMHQKTRYNIKVAQKHGVEIVEDNSDKAFKEYLKLTEETTRRQKFFAHTPRYHKLMWETLKTNNKSGMKNDKLSAHLLLAKYKNKILTAWIVFVFKDTLYYPYGASSTEYRETMASNLMMWEAIKFGKKLGLKKFDMWGALGPDPDHKDSWYGFHRFKQGYGGELVEFVGSYDLVINPMVYQIYKLADKIRWLVLKFK
jgi:lipid II:glycine glycyltransferase (peptidoglycan interpeptide bridge formation enzyme)